MPTTKSRKTAFVFLLISSQVKDFQILTSNQLDFARMILVLTTMTLTLGPTPLECFIHELLCLRSKRSIVPTGSWEAMGTNHAGITKIIMSVQQRG
jgi:hypothetical protein